MFWNSKKIMCEINFVDIFRRLARKFCKVSYCTVDNYLPTHFQVIRCGKWDLVFLVRKCNNCFFQFFTLQYGGLKIFLVLPSHFVVCRCVGMCVCVCVAFIGVCWCVLWAGVVLLCVLCMACCCCGATNANGIFVWNFFRQFCALKN